MLPNFPVQVQMQCSPYMETTVTGAVGEEKAGREQNQAGVGQGGGQFRTGRGLGWQQRLLLHPISPPALESPILVDTDLQQLSSLVRSK